MNWRKGNKRPELYHYSLTWRGLNSRIFLEVANLQGGVLCREETGPGPLGEAAQEREGDLVEAEVWVEGWGGEEVEALPVDWAPEDIAFALIAARGFLTKPG